MISPTTAKQNRAYRSPGTIAFSAPLLLCCASLGCFTLGESDEVPKWEIVTASQEGICKLFSHVEASFNHGVLTVLAVVEEPSANSGIRLDSALYQSNKDKQYTKRAVFAGLRADGIYKEVELDDKDMECQNRAVSRAFLYGLRRDHPEAFARREGQFSSFFRNKKNLIEISFCLDTFESGVLVLQVKCSENKVLEELRINLTASNEQSSSPFSRHMNP